MKNEPQNIDEIGETFSCDEPTDVIFAVANVLDVNPESDLPALSRAINPDTIENVIVSNTPAELSFLYFDCLVLVESTGTLTIVPPEHVE